MPPDMISGGAAAGWASFGLAGLILIWLFYKHLPSKDLQLEVFMKAKDAHIEAVVTAHTKEVENVILRFETTLMNTRQDFEKISTQQRTDFLSTLRMMQEKAESSNAAMVRTVLTNVKTGGEK